MKQKFATLLALGSFGIASIAFGQATAPAATPAPNQADTAQKATVTQQELQERSKSSAGSTGTPTTSVKEQRGKLETPEQKAAAQQELQKRSTSSAGAQPAVVDKNAPKQNPRKAYKDMTPEEKKKFEAAAKEASKP